MAEVVKRKIVSIDEEKCDGCGLCAPSCAEGAIRMVGGKAKLVAENLCDGLGNCIGACPKGAIIIEETTADPFDADAVADHLAALRARPSDAAGGCPGSRLRMLGREGQSTELAAARRATDAQKGNESRLGHWPIQLALVPVKGPLWAGTDVLISADCVPFAMAGFHDRLLAGGQMTLVIACPKLDDVDPYVDKLASILASNTIKSLTVAHMEVPCCSGIVAMVKEALQRAGRTDIPLRDITVSISGSIVDEG